MPGQGKGAYTLSRDRSAHGHNGHGKGGLGYAETIAFTVLAGIVLGLLAGYGLDRLLHTTPAFTVVGVFAGFGIALYGVFLETK